MRVTKRVTKSKVLKSSSSHRDYIFAFTILIFLTSIFAYQSVSASSSLQKRTFSHEIGYMPQQQRVDYSQAAMAYDDKDYIYAFRLLSILAEQGHNKAQHLFASQYDGGLGG